MEILYSFDYYTESWVEVSSQPSSSSLSSVTADDGLIPGFRVQQGPNARRRRRLHRSISAQVQGEQRLRPRSATGSSQEEYDESESESDRIMSSSNEGLQPRFMQQESPPAATSSASENLPSDEDDHTALGINTTGPVFTPQPNAFSHPPIRYSSCQAQSAAVPGSYFPPQVPTARPATQRHSYTSQCTTTRYDDALRASLSTLLSCAAAARALPKRDQPQRTLAGPSSNRIEPSTLRLVPESALSSPARPSPHPLQRQSSSSAPSIQGKGKRKSCSRDRHDTKKKRKGATGIEEMLISPTLMTWVVSAGVVVLFSAISFSAGFAYGKEYGRLEVAGGGGAGCAREVAASGRGYTGSLRRLRWGNASVVRV